MKQKKKKTKIERERERRKNVLARTTQSTQFSVKHTGQSRYSRNELFPAAFPIQQFKTIITRVSRGFAAVGNFLFWF